MNEVPAVRSGVASMSLADVYHVSTTKTRQRPPPPPIRPVSIFSSFMALFVLGWSTALVGSSVLVLALSSPTLLPLIASIVALLQAPVVCVQRYTLLALDSVRIVHNELRQQINMLYLANQELQHQVDYLEDQGRRLQQITKRLDDEVTRGGYARNAATFLRIIKENAETLEAMNTLIKEQILHQVLQIFCQVDRDRSFRIEADEVNELIHRVQTIPGVQNVDGEQIRRLLNRAVGAGSGKEQNLTQLMSLVKALQEDKGQSVVKFSSRSLVLQ